MKKLMAVLAVIVVINGFIAARFATSNVDQQPQDAEQAQGEAKNFMAYSAAVENIEPAGEPIPVTPKLLKHGEWVYRGMCVGCHGVDGDGNGAVWSMADEYAPEHKLPRQPRNFTEAVFKIRSTPSGSLPTDTDLFKSISRGLVADQDMPAFKFLPERDRWAVIAYIKSLSTIWEEEAEYQEDPIEVTEPPIPEPHMLTQGKDVYAKMKCAKCHGELGKGDGPSAPDLEDDNGLPIIPRDFSEASQFVGGSDPKSVFQTFNTGLDGTPMPSFLDFLDAEQSWDLVWYVISLRPDFDLEETRKQMMLERGVAYTPAAVQTDVQPTDPVTQEGDADEETAESESESDQQDEQVASEESEAVEVAAVDTEDASGAQADAAAADSDEGESADEVSSEETQVASTAETDGKESKFLGDYTETEVSDGGSIQGTVVYNGSVKKRTVLPTKDKKTCGKTRKVPWVLVGENGAVQDSVVYLKDVKEGKAWPEAALKLPVLDQEACQFLPHVQVGRQGDVEIINSDPVLHNTHGYYGKRTAFNVALPEKDQKITKTLKRPGIVKVDCDAHGWMLGWVQVVDNPYYFQTGEDGSFTIDDVPPGDYTMVVWQEYVGATEIPVSVTAGGVTEMDVELTK